MQSVRATNITECKNEVFGALYNKPSDYYNALLYEMCEENYAASGLAAQGFIRFGIKYKGVNYIPFSGIFETVQNTSHALTATFYRDNLGIELAPTFSRVELFIHTITHINKLKQEMYESSRVLNKLIDHNFSPELLAFNLGTQMYAIYSKGLWGRHVSHTDQLFASECVDLTTPKPVMQNFIEDHSEIITHMKERMLSNLLIKD